MPKPQGTATVPFTTRLRPIEDAVLEYMGGPGGRSIMLRKMIWYFVEHSDVFDTQGFEKYVRVAQRPRVRSRMGEALLAEVKALAEAQGKAHWPIGQMSFLSAQGVGVWIKRRQESGGDRPKRSTGARVRAVECRRCVTMQPVHWALLGYYAQQKRHGRGEMLSELLTAMLRFDDSSDVKSDVRTYVRDVARRDEKNPKGRDILASQVEELLDGWAKEATGGVLPASRNANGACIAPRDLLWGRVKRYISRVPQIAGQRGAR